MTRRPGSRWRRHAPASRLVGALAVAALTAAPAAALAQERTVKFGQVGSVGDVGVAESSNTGMVHVSGGLRLDTADYFRGAFDDVPERLEEFVIGPGLSVTFELWREGAGFLRDLGGAGVNVGIPLTFVPRGYGRWALNVGGHVVVRDDDIRRLSTFDGGDNVILLGTAASGFTD